MSSALRALAVALFTAALACGDAEPLEPPPPPPPAEEEAEVAELARTAALLLGHTFMGSAVYLGDGWLLTNWHVAVNSALLNVVAEQSFGLSVPRAEYLEDYLRGAGNALPRAGEVSGDDLYCLTASTATVAARFQRLDGPEWDLSAVPLDRSMCVPVLESVTHIVAFSWVPPPGPNYEGPPVEPELEFAAMGLDLAIARVPDAQVRAKVGDLPPVSVGFDAPLFAGQLVWVIGYPSIVVNRSPRRAVTELCQVVTPEVVEVADPDPIQPSFLAVPSFVIDCVSLQPGSSGSPVFDATTGRLLGLAWTADSFGYGYVSAAQGWKAWADARPGAPEAEPLRALMAREER